jgi:exosome complex component RRP42
METSNLTKNRIREYLSEGKRFDGRALDEFRDIIIETGVSKKAEGSARVKIGETEVIVGVKMDVGTPYPDSKDEGNMMVTAELTPMSSSRFELGPPKIEAIELARVIDRGVRESKVIDFKKLCIKEGEKVWTVFIDIYSINGDGNLLDAAGIGALAALKTAKIPKYDEENEKVLFGEWSEERIPLKVLPLSCTIHKIGKRLVVDPNREEEDASEARVTIAISNEGIHAMQKGDSKELKTEEFFEILDLAEKNYKNIFPEIQKHLK